MKTYEIKNKMYQVIHLTIDGCVRSIGKKSSITIDMSEDEKARLLSSYGSVVTVKQI